MRADRAPSEQVNHLEAPPGAGATWTYLTNHAHVLICLHRDSRLRVRDVAARVGITERAVQRIIVDLVDSGVLTRRREGRRNVYHINTDQHLRHPVEAHRTVAELLHLVNDDLRLDD